MSVFPDSLLSVDSIRSTRKVSTLPVPEAVSCRDHDVAPALVTSKNFPDGPSAMTVLPLVTRCALEICFAKKLDVGVPWYVHVGLDGPNADPLVREYPLVPTGGTISITRE